MILLIGEPKRQRKEHFNYADRKSLENKALQGQWTLSKTLQNLLTASTELSASAKKVNTNIKCICGYVWCLCGGFDQSALACLNDILICRKCSENNVPYNKINFWM
jgi:hypothetical protein